MYLCIYLNSTVIWNHFLGDRDPFMNGDSLLDYRIILHTIDRNVSERRWMR